jgi:MoxR-like ATPase
VRQATRLELHQISIDAARAVLHQQNLGQLVELATRRLVGERFADPVVAAAALEPLLPDIKEHAESAARTAAGVTAGTMIDVAREDIELARAEVVGLAREAAERAAAALQQARDEMTALARDASERANAALAHARTEVTELAREATATANSSVQAAREDVTELAEKATETAQLAVGEARAEVRELARDATETALRAGAEARAAVGALARDATETAQRAVDEARADLREAARDTTESAQRAVDEVRLAADGAVEMVQQAVDGVRVEVRQVADGAVGTAQRAVGEVQQVVVGAVETVQQAVDEARVEVRQVAGDAVGTAQRVIGEVRLAADGAAEMVRQAVDGVRVEVRQVAGDAVETALRAVGEIRQVVGGATEMAQRAAEEASTEVRQLARDAGVKAEAAVEQARAEVIELAREAAEKASAEFVPRPVEVRLPDGKRSRVTGHTHQVLPELLLALGARCHLLLVGPAGTGKSMLATHAATALGLPLQAISLGPTTPMSKVFGYYDAHGNYHDTPFRRAFEHGGVMLLDELDNGHPGLLAELNQALALGVCAFADGMVEAHPDFRLVATGNTYGTGGDRQYVGRQALDAATLDRFVVIEVPVDETLEERVAFALAPAKKRLVRELITEVRRLREVAAAKQLPVMFSPRVSYDGARLLAAGATIEQVLSWRVIRGLSSAHRSALGLTA